MAHPYIAFAGALLALGVVANDQPLTLAEAERLALEDEPGVVALLEQASASDQLAVAATQLPDPQVRFGTANLPLEGGDFRTEGMSQAQLAVRQVFPPIGTRNAAGHRQRAQGGQRRAQANERAAEVLLALRNAWLGTYEETRSRQLVLDAQTLFANLVTVSRSLYGVGTQSQQDLLGAELELSHLQARLIAAEEREAAARADIERWIDAAASRSLAPLPDWPPPPPLEELRAALAEHPAMVAAAAEIELADAGVALARSRFRPNWTLDAAYGYRDGGLADSSPRSDFFSISATVSAPLFAANRQHRGLRAAQAQRRAATAKRDALERRLESDLMRTHRRWEHLGRRLTLFDDVVLVQADANAKASLAAYRSEAAPFADVIRRHVDDLEVRLEHVRLTVDRRRSLAELAYLGGFEL